MANNASFTLNTALQGRASTMVIESFDSNFTKLSADSNGNYFKIYMNGLQPERYYRILFKQHDATGTIIYDDNYHFKVIR